MLKENVIMKVFISHDSRDRNRFVEEFAEKLMSKGIDIWYDKWELGYGDSLMSIFDEIVKCDIFISVISKYSVNSNWVKEESDAAFIRKIENKIKFIPVILMDENLKIPNQFNHMVQCRIDDINNYDVKLNELANDICGISKKPPLGTFQYLDGEDMIVFKKLGDFCLDNGFDYIFDSFKVSEICEKSDEELMEYIESLDDADYLKDEREQLGGAFISKSFTSHGFYYYFTSFVENYNDIYKDLINVIYRLNLFSFEEIVEEMDINKYIVLGLINYFKDEGYVEVYRYEISQITTKGKRYFKKFISD